MRVWTVQPFDLWETIEVRGRVTVDESLLNPHGYVPPAYRWLAEQLRARIAAWSGHLPWWAYCEKPDLRMIRHYRSLGSREVRIELEIPEERVASFPCWAWETVYGQNYLAFSREEHDGWMMRMRAAVPDEDEWPLPEPWMSELETSWECLFDPDLPVLSWDGERKWSRDVCREAVIEELRREDVRRVTLFTGVDRRRGRPLTGG